jgi:hypothetical protein|tara:strand:+ start:98 stop:397 length:300 start_codon:yes stop_codon:yes gene_type:complete
MTSPIKTNVISNLDGSITIASEQDDRIVKKLSDLNSKEKFHNRSTQYKGDSVMSHKVASIPMIVVEQMMREGIWGNQERMKVWMNDPANAMWRTTKGKL